MSTIVMIDAVSRISEYDFVVYCRKITKLMIKVAPEAINLQLKAFRILLVGLSFCCSARILLAIFSSGVKHTIILKNTLRVLIFIK